MAKIIKVESSTSTPKFAGQFKTSRNSATNPFKYQNFEGNTLDISAFADVFENSAVKETSKMRLIAASVAGSINKVFKSRITEPIRNFVNKVCGGISSAWDYAKSTNISDIDVLKDVSKNLHNFKEFMNTPIEMPGAKAFGEAIEGIKINLGAFNENVSDYGKGIHAKWSELVSKIHSNKKVSADMSVSELETLWKSELASTEVREAV